MLFNICGVTFDHTTNYGSCLQAYALQSAIEKVTIEDNHFHYDLVPYTKVNKNRPKSKKNIVSKAMRIVLKSITKKRRTKFQDFEKKYMHYVDCSEIGNLNSLNKKYDAFCCGSDVIWNLDFTKKDDFYLLAFAEKYKFSYGASFGVLNVENDFEYAKGDDVNSFFSKWIDRFDSISVREKSGKEYIESLTRKKGQVVCDPVILLSKNDWDKVCIDDHSGKDYIFAYSTYISPNYLKFLKKLHNQTGLKVVHVTWDSKEAIKRGIWSFPSPEKWLSLLKNAKYVVTNSFHGTAFCTIYHKNFYVVMRDDLVKGTRIRLYEFLEKLGLRDRIYGHTPKEIDVSEPMFNESDRVIEDMRNKSYLFLKENLLHVTQERK